MKASQKKSFKSALEELENMSDKELLHKTTHCPKCNKKIVPDKKAIRDYDGKWDGHTYKFPCKCSSKDLRLSIG